MSKSNANSFGSPDGLSPVDGLWARMESIEINASVTILKQLQDFAELFKNAYEAGVIVPTLKPAISPEVNLQCAALLLKRALNDFRGVWILLIKAFQPFMKSPSPISIARSRFVKKYPPIK